MGMMDKIRKFKEDFKKNPKKVLQKAGASAMRTAEKGAAHLIKNAPKYQRAIGRGLGQMDKGVQHGGRKLRSPYRGAGESSYRPGVATTIELFPGQFQRERQASKAFPEPSRKKKKRRGRKDDYDDDEPIGLLW